MKIDKFIAGYKASKNKETYIKNIIGKTYIPFEHKVSECKSIINTVMYERDENGNIIRFRQNSPSMWFFFNMTLIKNYTKLEINDENVVGDFNKLCESGLIDVIKDLIPEQEYITFDTILKMTYDDEIANERDIPAWIENRIGTMNTLLSTLAENEEIINKIQQVVKGE